MEQKSGRDPCTVNNPPPLLLVRKTRCTLKLWPQVLDSPCSKSALALWNKEAAATKGALTCNTNLIELQRTSMKAAPKEDALTQNNAMEPQRTSLRRMKAAPWQRGQTVRCPSGSTTQPATFICPPGPFTSRTVFLGPSVSVHNHPCVRPGTTRDTWVILAYQNVYAS